LHAKAIVRHQQQLRCGLEFQSLSVEQRAMIRRWTHRVLAIPVGPVTGRLGSATQIPKAGPLTRRRPRGMLAGLMSNLPPLPHWKSRNVLTGVGAALGLFLLLIWWQWNRGWQQLEAEVFPGSASAAATERLTVPPGAMEPLLVNKVDPVIPQ